MKIVDIRSHICYAAWRNWLFVEVETDTGLIGYGEATAEGRELTMQGHFEDLKRVLVGMDPFNINAIKQKLTRDSFWVGGYVGGTGLAGIEIACWDLMGKSLGVPVWQLFGGKLRDRVEVYANGWYFGASTVDEWVERAGQVVELGYRALKFDPFGVSGFSITRDELEKSRDIITALRSAVGPRVELLIEGHGRFSVESASRIAPMLVQHGCMFFEEPVPPGAPSATAEVAKSAGLPIAGGERCYSVLDAQAYLDVAAVQVLQPDLVHAGGISESVSIAAMANSRMVSLAPHNPNGGVATAATLTVDAVAPNFLIQEMLAPWDVPWRHEVVRGVPEVVDGFIEIPTGPGLGVELDLDAIRRHPMQPADQDLWGPSSSMDIDLRPAAASGESV